MLWATALCVCAGLGACDPDDPCDPGYYPDHGACLRTAASPDAGSAGRAAEADADAGESYGAKPPFNAADFGTACSTDADCRGSAPVCGGAMFPICTAVNCKDGSVACPESWTCLDIAAFSPDPTIRSACVQL